MREIPEIGLVVHDLVGGNSLYIDDYLAIYEELFPQYSRYAPVMRWRAEKPAHGSAIEKWHQWLLVVKNIPVGIIGFIYNKKKNVGVLLDFAIRPEARRIQYNGTQRLAHLSLNLAMQELIRDAQLNGYNAPLCMAAEVEHPALVRKYVEYGFVKFPVEYFEPPYTPELIEASNGMQNLDRIGYERMDIGAFQISGHPFDANDPTIIRIVLLALLEDHYHLPADHWLAQKMFREIPV